MTADTSNHAPGAYWLELANETTDSLDCIAMALTGILELGVRSGEAEAKADSDRALVDQLDAELGERDGTLAAVRAALGKSTSQVAEKVRAALGDEPAKAESPVAYRDGAPVEPAPKLEQPVRDADIETWRAYGAQEGLADVHELNRSQIRSALGIPNA